MGENRLLPSNKMAQFLHRSVGNPINTLPTSAISNCFPGLDYDFKNFWRRAFQGIVFLEWDNYVIEVDDPQYEHLKHHRMLRIDGKPIVVSLSGPKIPGGEDVPLPSEDFPNVITMEWSNALAFVVQRQGQRVRCDFTMAKSTKPHAVPDNPAKMKSVELTVRHFFDATTGSIAKDLLKPGELTQGLCSPWQHDYRECACYYWPASRPDYVNVEPGPQGVSQGDNWMCKKRTGEYILDDRVDGRLITYEELFIKWEEMLRFQIQGRDAESS
jgi:hypothetical protein